MGLVTASGDQTASRPSLGDLRRMVARIERPTLGQSSRPALPFAVDAIDARLPARGLALGAVHELAGTGPDTETAATPALFAASILARRPGPVIWIIQRGGVFGHGLLQAGLDPRRVVLVDAGGAALPIMEEALRQPRVAGVVCEAESALGLVASRRLQLAAEGARALGLLIRRSRRFDDPALSQPSAAMTQWRVGVLPSLPLAAARLADEAIGLPRPLWRLDLLRCRGGQPASWIVEGADAQGRLALAAVLADREAAPARRRAAGR